MEDNFLKNRVYEKQGKKKENLTGVTVLGSV